MIRTLKERITLLLTVLFLASIAVSAYMLFRLPNNLMIPDGFESTFNPVYMAVGISFLLGILAVTQAMRYRKELVVYRERTAEMSREEQEAESNKNNISVESIKAVLRTAKNSNDALLNGLQSICKQLEAGQGAAYLTREENQSRWVELKAGYAFTINESTPVRYDFGEGLIGQAASNGQLLYLDEVPEGYINIISGLGSASPRFLLIVPIKQEDKTLGILEIASFAPFNAEQKKFAEQSAGLVAEKLSSN